MRTFLLSALVVCVAASTIRAQQPKKGEAIELKLVAKKDTYTWDGGGKTPKEFKQMLDDLAKAQKKNPFGPKLPNPPTVDLVLQIVNNSKEDQVIWVGGDPNQITLELKGPGVTTVTPSLAFTLELRLSKQVTLAPGKHYEIPVTRFADGFRSSSRWIYWTEPGEYTISAQYQLANGPEEKGKVLKSEPVKLKVNAK